MSDENDRAGLEGLGTPPAPRRTDDAFARSVADAVGKKRMPRAWLAFPAIAAGAAAVTALVVRAPGIESPDAGFAATSDAVAVVDDDVTDVTDVSDELEDDDDADRDEFAFAAIEGSDEQELLAFEARLDGAITQALANRKL